MPPNTSGDAIVIALDVGRSVSHSDRGDGKTYFQQARECVSWIIQRKIVSQSIDSLGLLLIGSEETDNRIASGGYKNINCKFDLQYASWDMLKYIENEIQSTENESDWVGALIVALEMLKVHEECNNVKNKKIVLFSDFIESATDDINIIIKSIKALNIEINLIGPNSSYFAELLEEEEEDSGSDDGEPAAKKRKESFAEDQEKGGGKKIVVYLQRRLPDNIVFCTFESALKQLCSYTRKAIRVTPWNCILDIGDVKINISMLKKTDPKSAKKFNTKYMKPSDSEPQASTSSQVSDELSNTIRDKVMYYKHANHDKEEYEDIEVKEEDTIEGFRYGTTVIPFTDQDKQILAYKSGPKCFSILGFTNFSSVPHYLLSGESSYVVVPRDKDENAEVALSAIVQAMKKTELLAIVRRVYSDNRGLSLGILYPLIEEIENEETEEVSYKECLLFVELAFKEDVKCATFPSLNQFAEEIKKEQYDAVDKLIDEMNLMKADRGLRGEMCEAFGLSTLHDVKEQFFQYCVVQKGLYPEKSLPSAPPPYIEKFIQQPKEIEERIQETVKEIKKLFKIKQVKESSEKSKEKKDKQKDDQKKNEKDSTEILEHFSKSVVSKENNKVKKGWMTLFMKSFPTDSVLENFLYQLTEGDHVKEKEILFHFQNVFKEVRHIYLTNNPNLFNRWLRKFKIWCCESEDLGDNLWNVVVTENLGLVSKTENALSTVSEKEGEFFVRGNATQSSQKKKPEKKKQDVKTPEKKNLEAEQMSVDSFF